MLSPYTKPHLSFADQLCLLKSRGMAVGDDALALTHLERIGYYRLKSYWHPFRAAAVPTAAGGIGPQVSEQFKPGTEFRFGVELYVFDKRLRLLLLDAIERVEIAMRVDIAFTLGRRDGWAHRSEKFLDPKRAVQIGEDGLTRHQAWLTRAEDAERRSKADWVEEYRQRYSTPLPVWMAVELWEFGALSRLLEIAHPVDRHNIGLKYGIPDANLLVSWIKTLAYVRNICAHHGRLWNQALVIQPKLAKGGAVPRLSHLATHVPAQTRVYAAAAVAQHFLSVINPTSTWKVRLRALWASFPSLPGISPAQAGFMPNWGAASLWQ